MLKTEQDNLLEFCKKEIYYKRILRDKWITMDLSKITEDSKLKQRESIIQEYNKHIGYFETIQKLIEETPIIHVKN